MARLDKRLRLVTINDVPYSFTNNELLDKDTGACIDGFPCSVPRQRTGANDTLVAIINSNLIIYIENIKTSDCSKLSTIDSEKVKLSL